MKTLFRNSLYQGKNMFRDFGFSFWSLLYPIILVSFFYTAFSGITNIKYENVKIGIERGNPLSYVLESIDIVDTLELSKDRVNDEIDKEKIDGFIDNDLSITIKNSGINQTIIKEIVEQTKQMQALNLPMESFDFSVDYIRGESHEANGILVIFYSLIAMVSTYGIFAGIETVSLAQGNLTYLGARLNITPLRKGSFILAGVMVGLLLNLLSNAMLLLFIKYVLKMNLFTEIKYSLIFIILGNLFGLSLGIFIGASNRQSMGAKTMMSIAVTLVLSFLSGMMSPDIKVMLDRHVPILGRINPIAIVTNNLYRINLLGNTRNIWLGALLLFSYSIAFLLASYMFLRRRNYDSI